MNQVLSNCSPDLDLTAQAMQDRHRTIEMKDGERRSMIPRLPKDELECCNRHMSFSEIFVWAVELKGRIPVDSRIEIPLRDPASPEHPIPRKKVSFQVA